MNRAQLLSSTAAAVAAIALLAGCAGGEEPGEAAATPSAAATAASPGTPAAQQTADPASPVPQAAGAYIDSAQYQADPAGYAAGGDVVLFFNASWCPTCRSADANFSEEDFPPGLTVVSVDYDDNTALRQQYGVTVQHTFVQVDADGNELAKWTGSATADQVADQVV